MLAVAVYEQQHEGVQWFIPFAYLMFVVLLIQVVVVDRLKYVADFGVVLLFMLLLTGGVVIDNVYKSLRPDRAPSKVQYEHALKFFIAAVSLPAMLLITQPSLFILTGYTLEMLFVAIVVLIFAGAEEYICRKQIPRLATGLITNPKFKRLEPLIGYTIGNTIFMLLHFGVGVYGMISAFTAGVLLAMVFEFTGSFLGTVATHWGWNMLVLGLGFTLWFIMIALITLALAIRGYI